MGRKVYNTMGNFHKQKRKGGTKSTKFQFLK